MLELKRLIQRSVRYRTVDARFSRSILTRVRTGTSYVTHLVESFSTRRRYSGCHNEVSWSSWVRALSALCCATIGRICGEMMGTSKSSTEAPTSSAGSDLGTSLARRRCRSWWPAGSSLGNSGILPGEDLQPMQRALERRTRHALP